MSRLSVRFVATSLAAALAAPSVSAAQAASSPAAPPQAAPAPNPASNPAPSGSRVLTLDDALALAEARNESVLIAEAGVRRARGVQAQVHSQRLPQLTGTASYDRTLASEFDGLFDADSLGNGDGQDNAFADLPFGQPNAYRLGLSFSQLIYAGGREHALESQARLGREVATLSVVSAKAQLSLDVAQAFYDAALADRLVTIADETLAQATRSFEQTRAKREAGLASEFEQLRAQVDRDTLQSPRVRAGNTRDVAYFRLKQLLDLPLGTPLQLAAQLDDPRLAPATRFATRLAEAEAAALPRLRTAVTQADLGVQANEQAVVVADAQRKPAIAFQSAYGVVNYPSAFPGLDDWRTNWTFSLGVQLPILTGGRIKAEQNIARADLDGAKAQLQLIKELSDLDDASARASLGAARADWEVAAGTIQQAARAYEIAELRFREGLSTQLELSDARLLLAQAQVNRARAARDLQLTRVRLALLPELPLGAGGGAGSAMGGGATQGSASNATASTGSAQAPAAGATATPAATGAQGARQ
ncbi:MAG: TolC family protein [Vicinamibacteraceae bacterium]